MEIPVAWQFKEIGHITDCNGHPANEVYVIKSGQWCEECHCFLGRWISCVCIKVWCKGCTKKLGLPEKTEYIDKSIEADVFLSLFKI
jgi:hypothetical protein